MRIAALALLTFLPLSAATTSDLRVQARYPRGSQGTMHFTEALILSVPSARPLTLKGSFLPIPGPSFRLPDSRYILLGWSSAGSGMQSIHVFLLGIQNGSLRRLASLTSLTDRPSSGLLVRRATDGSVVLGLPKPPTRFLHNEDEWSLALDSGESTLSIAAIRQLRYEAITPLPDDLFYSPPAQLAPRPNAVSWVAITPHGFSLNQMKRH